MAVTIAIGKQAPAQQVAVEETVEQTGFDPRVDELAELLAWEAKMKKDAKALRLAELKKEFAALANSEDHADEEEVVFEGEKNRYKFGKPSDVRTVTVEGKELFANKVGEKAFLECATIALKDIDQYIPKAEQKEYLEYSTGSRTGKVEAKVVAKKK